MKGTIFLH